MSVVIETTLGDITVDLFVQQRPMACNNFLKLCKLKYYNFVSFHFIQRDFIAQTGDPTGTGTGGHSVYAQTSAGDNGKQFIMAETKPKIKHDRFGLISMVNNGQNMHGSQFFFTLCHSLDYLDGLHTVFGVVSEGKDVLLKLNDTICDEKNHPYQDIMITHTVVLDDPFPDIEGLEIPISSPDYKLEDLLNSERIGIGEDIVDDDKPVEVIEEELKDKDAKQRALVLEMVGDIPDADMAPPENVLFICKLNPVTREEDLEIIFSRFGRIMSCEIIKDEKSQESLQYGFIEFENKEECEKAYFKMDNVLIDDRRIHVDFSQSVSKIKWRGKGKGVTLIDDNSDYRSSKTNSNRHFEPQPGQRSASNHRYQRSDLNGNNSRDQGFSRNDRYKSDPDANQKQHRTSSLSSSSKRRERSRSPDRTAHKHSSSSSSSKYHKSVDNHPRSYDEVSRRNEFYDRSDERKRNKDNDVDNHRRLSPEHYRSHQPSSSSSSRSHHHKSSRHR